jgi:hypothetical protein
VKSLIVLLMFLPPVWAEESRCAVAEKESWLSLSRTALTLDVGGGIRQSFLLAANALPSCQQDETLWYVLMRASELGFGMFPIQVGSTELNGFDDALHAAVKQFPRSPRLATIFARHAGTVKASRRAVDLDPAYTPARVALAAAQLSAGDAKAAVTTLVMLKDRNRIIGANLLLGRARLADGDPEGAIEAARLESQADVLHTWEPGAAPRDDSKPQTDELVGMAHLAAGRYSVACRHLLAAAAEGSESARGTLKTDPKLRDTLTELIKSGRLRLPEEALARELTGVAPAR